MKTRELIAALQEEDPSGELEVIAGGSPIYFVERQHAYYDGALRMLVHDDSLRPYYSIVGMKITTRGQKVRLHTMDVDDVLLDNPEAPIEIDVEGHSMARWERYVEQTRERMKETYKNVEKWAAQQDVLTPKKDRKA